MRSPGCRLKGSRSSFAAISSIGVYAMFVLTQTVRHRDFFVPVDRAGKPLDDEDAHGPAPSTRAALNSSSISRSRGP